MALWSDTLSVTVSVNGVVVGSTTTGNISEAHFGAGRRDWFDPLAPATGTFTFKGMTLAAFKTLIGATHPAGKSVVVALSGSTLWTGVVDTAVEDPVPGEPTTVTITAVDQVGQLGQTRLEDEDLFGPAGMTDQIPDVFGFAGLSPTVTAFPGAGAALEGIDPLSGSVLDWLTHAEGESNSIIAPTSTGDIVVMDRGYFGDYGDRVTIPGVYVTTGAGSLWRMDESSGSIADSGADEAGRDGTAAGTPTYGQTGPWGASGPDAIAFQASDAADKFTVGDQFDLTGGTWDIGVWFYWTGTNPVAYTIVSKFTASPSNNGWVLDVSSATGVRFRTFNSGTTTTTINSGSGTISTGTWYHVNVSASGGTVRLHLNGVTVDSDTLGTIPNTTADLRVGTLGNAASWWDGRLCMLSIWNSSALTATEVSDLIYLGRVQLAGNQEPYRWTRTESITTVVNHWIFRQFGGVTSDTDATSITAYGDRTFEVDSDAISALGDVYSAALRAHLENPRPTISCAFHVTGSDQSFIVALQPLDYVTRDGEEWQVMSVQHDISVDRWEVTATLSETVAGLTGAGPALPV